MAANVCSYVVVLYSGYVSVCEEGAVQASRELSQPHQEWVRSQKSSCVLIFLFCCLVLTKPPYEITETGWGEFEVVIKVFFYDSSEKPVC